MKKSFLCLVIALLMLVTVSALAETAAIPVVSLDGEILESYTTWSDKSTYHPATLTFTDGDTTFTQEIEIKPQGTSSLFAPKKNFTLKFSQSVEMKTGWGAQQKYVLKADYIDPTRSSNVVSAKLAAEMNAKYGLFENTPNHGVIDGFPVWVKINGEDAGIFNLTIPKDTWMMGMDGENPNHLLLACESWSAASTMRSAVIDYEADWSFEIGEANDASKAAFERMVKFVSTADDATFVADFDQYLNLDACLNYLCFANIAYASDNVAKNMLMATYDGKVWYPVLYDLDSLWGIDYDGKALAQINGKWSEALLTDGNTLLHRVYRLFGQQVRQRYWELREGILSKEHIMEAFQTYMAQIPQHYYDIDRGLWNADGSLIRTLDLMSRSMDEYLPLVDAHFSVTGDGQVSGPAIHYVWETNGVQQSADDVAALPVSMTLSYMLDGKAITAEELAGKSGHVDAVLRVERKAYAEHIYGVAALLHLEEAQCANITVIGGNCTTAAQDYACMGTSWLGGDQNTYEMRVSMDVTDFDPAKYIVAVNPVYVEGGEDHSLDALLATAGEMTNIINEGILLHESMTDWHAYLKSVSNGMLTVDSLAKSLAPADDAAEEKNAASVVKTMLADAEVAADEMLTAMGYELAEGATNADRVQLLAEVAADSQRTEEEKTQAAKQQALLENYMLVSDELAQTREVVDSINTSMADVVKVMPDLVSAYAYANDGLYGILYKISTLYQSLENFFYAYNGGGYADFTFFGNWYDIIIFSNYEGAILP